MPLTNSILLSLASISLPVFAVWTAKATFDHFERKLKPCQPFTRDVSEADKRRLAATVSRSLARLV